jgi:hypothetical protein
MERSDALMLSGTTAMCPECGEEQVLVAVEADCYCCTTCDAAVLLFEIVPGPARRLTSRAS